MTEGKTVTHATPVSTAPNCSPRIMTSSGHTRSCPFRSCGHSFLPQSHPGLVCDSYGGSNACLHRCHDCPWLSLAVLLRGSFETENESLPYPLDLGLVTCTVVASCLVAPRSQSAITSGYDDGRRIASDRPSSTINQAFQAPQLAVQSYPNEKKISSAFSSIMSSSLSRPQVSLGRLCRASKGLASRPCMAPTSKFCQARWMIPVF